MSGITYIKRVLEKSIKEAPKDKALVLFGARQIGKTTLLQTLFNDPRTRWLSGDETDDVTLLTSLTSKSDLKVLLGGVDVLVIDEAQRVPGIGLLLKRLIDADTGCRIVATGSSSLELAGGVMESAAGRLWQERLWPISVEELAEDQSWLSVVSNLPERLVWGNYPYIIREPKYAQETLKNLYDSVVFKDIFSLSGIRKHDKFQHLVQLLAYNIGGLISYERLGQESGLNALSVANYVSLLEQCFIVKTLSSYSRNLAHELKKSKKIYFCDLGIRNAAINNFQPFSARDAGERGALWENFFVMERLKMHDYRKTGANLYFWRDKQMNEVDLVEILPDATMRAFECKTKESKVAAPAPFTKKYPECSFEVANMQNFYRYFV